MEQFQVLHNLVEANISEQQLVEVYIVGLKGNIRYCLKTLDLSFLSDAIRHARNIEVEFRENRQSFIRRGKFSRQLGQ